jgi:hypothetical protein
MNYKKKTKKQTLMSMKQWQLSITIQTSSTRNMYTQVSTQQQYVCPEPILLLSYILQHGNPSVRECLEIIHSREKYSIIWLNRELLYIKIQNKMITELMLSIQKLCFKQQNGNIFPENLNFELWRQITGPLGTS